MSVPRHVMSTDNTERVENTRAFWDATVALEARAAQSCLNRIAALTPEITAFGFDAETEEDDLPGGEPSDGVVAAGTPRGMVGAWNGGGGVSLKLMSREDHCCAKVGAIKPSPTDFKACAAGTPDGEAGCVILGHHDRRAKQHILNLDPGGEIPRHLHEVEQLDGGPHCLLLPAPGGRPPPGDYARGSEPTTELEGPL